MNLHWVSSALEATSIEAITLNPTRRQDVLEGLSTQLDLDVTSPAPWDADSAPEGRLLPEGWKLIADYVGDRPCLLFFEGAQTIWGLHSGSDLNRLLMECPPLEFYVCDEQANYLLCANDHDVVIGWGDATAWVRSLGCG